MHNFIFKIFLGGALAPLFISQSCLARISEKKSQVLFADEVISAKTEPKVLDLYDLGQKKMVQNKAILNSPMTQMRFASIRADFDQCLKQAPVALKKQTEFRKWILIEWGYCAHKKSLIDLQSSVQHLEKWISVVKNDRDFSMWLKENKNFKMLFMISEKQLIEHEVIKLEKSVQDKKNVTKKASKRKNLDFSSVTMNLLLARIDFLLNLDLGNDNRNESRSENKVEEKESLFSLANRVAKLSQEKQAQTQFESLLTSGLFSAFKETNVAEKALRIAVKNNDVKSVSADLVQYFSENMGGFDVESLSNRLPDILSGLSAESRRSIWLSCETLAPVRLLEWAKAYHKRANFVDAFELARMAAPHLLSGNEALQARWIAGRSAQFIGQYSEAKKYLRDVVEHFAKTTEAGEALLRLGLVQMRLKDFDGAVSTFSDYLKTPPASNELTARYWLVRAISETGKSELNGLRDENVKIILSKYPTSYYAIRLGSKIVNNQEVKADDHWYMLSQQKQKIERAKKLLDDGWLPEAQAEVQDLYFPLNGIEKKLLLKKLYEIGAYPVAIRFMNKFEDEEAATDFNLRYSYISPFDSIVKTESENNRIASVVVRSLMRQESAFGSSATSTSNAMGLMQLIPPTAVEVAKSLNLKNFEVEDAYRPEFNVRLGTKYIAQMIRQFQSVPLGLAAYNAGPVKVSAFVEARDEMKKMKGYNLNDWRSEIWFDELPWAETQFYVKAILRNMLIYQALENAEQSNRQKPTGEKSSVIAHLDQGELAFWADLYKNK